MSWEPTWVPDGRGGFRRNRAGSEEGEEVEDGGGERKENESEMKNSNNRGEDDDDDDDSEEEGEIAPAGAAAAAAAGPPSQHHRSTSSGHLDSSSSTFRGPYRGRGHNNNPRFARPPRQPRNTSFSGAIPPHFNREGSFSGSNNSNPTPFEISSSSSSLRKNGPPPPPPPPPPFRGGEPPPFRDSHNPRDIMDAPPPRGAGRDYRDLSGPRGDGGGGAFGGREFRKEPPPLPPKRDFGEGPPNRDFRGGEPPLPPNRDFRGGGEPPNRDFRGGEPPNRDFRGEPPSARDFRGEPPNRDFRGGEPPLNRSPANRDFRADGGPPNNRGNFRDRAEGISHPNRDFRDRDTFGSDVYPNPNKDRGDNRDTPFGNAPPLHRESSFGAGPGLSPTPAFRDGPAPRDPNFRDGPPFRDGPSRDGPFRDGPSRDVPFREGPSRETSFHKRETSFSSLDRGRPAEPPLNREPSFGTGPPREPPFGLNRGESGGPRDHSFGGPRGGPPREPGPHTPHGPFHRESNRDEPTAPANFSPAIPNNKLVQTGPPTAPPKGRPTDPRRRPSKDIGGVLAPQGGPTTNNAADLAALDPRRSPGSMAGPPFVDGSEAPPPPHHRVSSYSSLADTSSMAATGHDGAPNQDSRPGGSFRSPVGRRALVEPGARNDRGDRYGPAGPTPQRHWSPASDRNRPLLSNNAPTPDRQQSQSAPSQQPPFVPFISSRPSNFRSNDPRFKHHQEKTQVDSAGRTDSETNASSMPPTSTDPFGRSRDWKDRPFGHQTPNTTPRSSPLKQKTTFKPFSSSPSKEKNEAKETKSLSEQPKVPSREPAQELPPLLMSLLSDEEEIKRAKTAVQHLSEVISGPSLQVRTLMCLLLNLFTYFCTPSHCFLFSLGPIDIADQTVDYGRCRRDREIVKRKSKRI